MWIFICSFSLLYAQEKEDTSLQEASLRQASLRQAPLRQVVDYAFQHQPDLQRAMLDQRITERDIAAGLSGWLPQVNLNFNAQHYLKLPVSIFPDLNNPESGEKRAVTLGLKNTSNVQLSAEQTIFSNDALFASKTAHIFRLQSEQQVENAKINLVVDVSKAYYDALLTEQQLKVINEDIQRLKRNLEDTYDQYQSGISDKIDYKRATLALNNARSEKKTLEEADKVKYAYLKQLIGYPEAQPLSLSYDTAAMRQEVQLDTTQNLQYENRVEYQLLQTALNLQQAGRNYYRWQFLPSLSAFYTHNLVYQNDQLSSLYAASFPNSLVGLRLSLPLFLGNRRMQDIRKADLQYQQLELDMINLKSQLNTEYIRALGAYKSTLYELKKTAENEKIARDIFNTVKLQYDEGIKAYLEVIVSETDLRTAELNYLNTLFQLLSSKLEVQKTLGSVAIQPSTQH